MSSPHPWSLAGDRLAFARHPPHLHLARARRALRIEHLTQERPFRSLQARVDVHRVGNICCGLRQFCDHTSSSLKKLVAGRALNEASSQQLLSDDSRPSTERILPLRSSRATRADAPFSAFPDSGLDRLRPGPQTKLACGDQLVAAFFPLRDEP